MDQVTDLAGGLAKGMDEVMAEDLVEVMAKAMAEDLAGEEEWDTAMGQGMAVFLMKIPHKIHKDPHRKMNKISRAKFHLSSCI